MRGFEFAGKKGTSMTFDEFLVALPKAQPASRPIEAAAVGWASYVNAPNPRFVAPPLHSDNPIVTGRTSVVLVSAAGAVGKSTLGKEIARRTGAPLVNLATRKVGSDAAVGLITKMFGAAAAPLVFSELADGTSLVVLDALDETKVGSGDGNFDAFLEDLASLVKAERSRPVFVLLARTETADWIEYFLVENRRIPLARYAIDYFAEEAAREFVDRYAKDRASRAGFGPVEPDSTPFRQARDGLLEGIKREVATDEQGEDALVRSVVGYAPVLEAVGEYLLEEESRKNYHRLLQALKQKGREWELLLQVAEALLQREQQKMASKIREKLEPVAGARWSQWDQLYLPEEQFHRLLARRFKLHQPTLPVTLPPDLRHEYERSVEHALDEHPFRGSALGLHPVFGEYLYARVLADPTGAAFPGGDRVREVLKGENYLPTRALCRFVLTITARTAQPRIAAGDFGFLYESILSDQEKPGDVWLVLSAIGSGDDHHGWLLAHGQVIDFRVTDTEKGIWFWRRLAYMHASVRCGVELGFPGGEFGLGPSVDLECSTISCPALEMRVYLGNDNEEDEVVLVARTFERMGRAPGVHGKHFVVRGETVPWPWSAHQDRDSMSVHASEKVVEAYNHLARILLWFRASGYRQMARVDDLVEKVAPGGTRRAKALLGFCVDQGLIRPGRVYVLNDDTLARYQINYADLKRRVLREPVIRLLEDFLREGGA